MYLSINKEHEEAIKNNIQYETDIEGYLKEIRQLRHENKQISYKSRQNEKYHRDFLAADQ